MPAVIFDREEALLSRQGVPDSASPTQPTAFPFARPHAAGITRPPLYDCVAASADLRQTFPGHRTPGRRVTMHWPWGETGRRYLGDLVYGANDGIITTFAVAAGVAGAALQPHIVLVLGLANLVADGFSMAASNFLSIRSRNAIATADGGSPELEPIRHATATFLAFITAGAIPLLAYVLPFEGARFSVALAFTAVTLFAVGAARSLVTAAGYLRSGAEMLLVGAAAAAVAYGIGRLLGPLAAG